MDIAAIRKEYSLQTLDKEEVDINPFGQFSAWWSEAIKSNIDEVNAMTLATSDLSGKPSARIVLLKGFTEEGFIFFTNYNSHKSAELAINPQAALVFFWKELERQIRIEGVVSKTSIAENEQYFSSRPIGSRIGAWASPQSSFVENRSELETRVTEMQDRFAQAEINCPPFWGGFIIKPTLFEFWQGRQNRLHDRIQYNLENNIWEIARLAP